MKTLFYNPMELPSKIHIVSKAFDIDIIYEEPYNNVDFSIAFDELFNMAQCDCFDQVEVYIASHVQAYLRPNKNSHEKTDVIGWISLKELKTVVAIYKIKTIIFTLTNFATSNKYYHSAVSCSRRYIQ